MRTKRIVCLAALICAAVASFWFGAQRGMKSRSRTETAVKYPDEGGAENSFSAGGKGTDSADVRNWPQTAEESSPPERPAAGPDLIVVETEMEIAEQMQQWAKQGSNVAWISGPMRREDGTIYRTAKLMRARR
jgi:hypothetical protein